MGITTITGPNTVTTVRTTELARLTELVRAARDGRPALVELTGDPGTGKTRLLTALAREARGHGLAVLHGRCSEAEAQVPFHPVVQALTARQGAGAEAGTRATATAALVEALTDVPPGAEQSVWRSPYFAGVRRLLTAGPAASPGGTLLVLDDFHWADAGSARLVETLIRWPVDRGLMVVVAHRPRQAPIALRAVLQQGGELGAVETLTLGALAAHRCAEVLGLSADAPELPRLYTHSGGNPLYLTALAEAGSPAGDALDLWTSSSLGARLLAETELLPAVPRRVVHAAAVLGSVFDIDAVAEVAETSRDEACRALSELRRRDLVRSTAAPGALAFRHPLLRGCLYADADACWRSGAHRRARDRCVRLGLPALDIAPHIERAGSGMRPADAEVLAAAARACVQAGRPAEAAHWLTSALRLGRRAGDGGSTGPADGELWKQVVRALAAEGDAERIVALLADVLAGPDGRSPQLRARAVAFLAAVLAALGHDEDAQALLAAELPAAQAASPGAGLLLRVSRQLGKVLAGQVPARTDVEVLVHGTDRADPVTAGGALGLAGLCAVLDGDMCAAEMSLDAAAQALDEVDSGRQAGDQEAGHLLVLSWAEALMGWYGPAYGHAERALTAVRARGDVHFLPPLLDTLGYVHYQSGRLADALGAVREGSAAARAMGRGDHVALSDAITAAAWAQLGRTSPRPATTGSFGRDAPEPRTPLNALLLAEASLASGDADSALALLLPEREAWRVSEPVAVFAARNYELLAAAAVQTEADADTLDAWAERAAAAASATGLAEQSGHALLARGHALMGRALTAEAARCYGEAQRLFGDSSPAGARARELARSAVRLTARRESSGLDELTLREREVAELAGEGLKTKDIAGRLRVSPRTVDVHLTHIYSKLGVNSRAALVRLMALAG
ncbi:AAA family ATPase [Streptomyces sp. NPDC050273]|uniref:ATP-binding protein n=1 Tax=unclassified Streptomyces TaxID=2593676 RepID=UPI002E2B056B|nr:AAA family ATPase [Streptomyces sp. NBC_00184]